MTKVEELQTALLLFIAGQLTIANAALLHQVPNGKDMVDDIEQFRETFDRLREQDGAEARS